MIYLFYCVIIFLVYLEFRRLSSNLSNFLIKKSRSLIYSNVAEIYTIYETSRNNVYADMFLTDFSIHFNNKTKLTPDEIKEYTAKFIKQVFEVMGPKILTDMEFLKGNIDSIVKELEIFFENKLIEEQAQFLSDDDMGDDQDTVKVNNKILDNININY